MFVHLSLSVIHLLVFSNELNSLSLYLLFFVGYATAAVALQYSMPLTYLNLLYRFISIRLNTRHCFRIEPIQTALLRAAMCTRLEVMSLFSCWVLYCVCMCFNASYASLPCRTMN